MRRRSLTLTAFAFVLASGVGVAQAQQSTEDRPMPQREQQSQQSQGMMGSDPGRVPEMMQQGRMGMGHGMMGRHGSQSGMTDHGGMLRMMFAIMDADGDDALALAEVQDIHARIFKHIDADKDGKVTLEEIQGFFGGTVPAPASSR